MVHKGLKVATIKTPGERVMHSDENDVFDDSVDPYDRSIDFDFDDGIADVPGDELDDADEADWDSSWEDENIPQVAQSDEMTDYDEIED